MIKLSNKSLALALVASLAAPLAFAQDATTETAPPAEQAPPVTEANVTAPQALSWNDVDINQDGVLNQTEAAAVPSLMEVFAEADANADGSLTPEEYQSYVAAAPTTGGGTYSDDAHSEDTGAQDDAYTDDAGTEDSDAPVQ